MRQQARTVGLEGVAKIETSYIRFWRVKNYKSAVLRLSTAKRLGYKKNIAAELERAKKLLKLNKESVFNK